MIQVVRDTMNGWTKVAAPWVTLVVMVILQVAVVVGFAIRVDARASFHDEQIVQLRNALSSTSSDLRSLTERIDRLDTPLARRVTDMGKIVDVANATVAANTGRIEVINRDLAKMEARIDTIVRALDSVYGQLVDHMKDHNGGHSRTPATPPRPSR